MLDLGDKKLCDLCFEEVINEACVSCDGISNLSRYTTALKEGTVLAGKYAVGRVLGKGGFGVTYLCFNLENGENTQVTIEGRHDPCIVPRALPALEAMLSIATLDLIAQEGKI